MIMHVLSFYIHWQVPGALCLLQEVGEAEVVIQAGQKLLQERLPKSFKRDVMLAMALSYVDIYWEANAESSPNIIWHFLYPGLSNIIKY